MVGSSPSSLPVGISRLIPLNCESICGTGGNSSEFIFSSRSVDLFFNPPHLRSDHLDPGRDPGRETGRAESLIMMLGTLRKEGGLEPPRSSIELRDWDSRAGDGVCRVFLRRLRILRALRAEVGRLSGFDAASLALRDRPLGSGGASAGTGSETDLIARGRSTATVFS